MGKEGRKECVWSSTDRRPLWESEGRRRNESQAGPHEEGQMPHLRGARTKTKKKTGNRLTPKPKEPPTGERTLRGEEHLPVQKPWRKRSSETELQPRGYGGRPNKRANW